MRAGLMRTRLAYQLPTQTIDADGGEVEAWVDQFSLWARVQPIEGTEAVQGSQVVAQVKHRVSTRYRAEFAPTGRFVIARTNRILHIEGVLDAETRGAETTLSCVERVGETP